MIDIKPPRTGDAYLDNLLKITDSIDNYLQECIDDNKAQVLVTDNFLKRVEWVLEVGHKAYMNNSSDDLYEISKTLKEILREMRKKK